MKSVVLFGSILLSHSKTINTKVISFPDPSTKLSNKKALQFWRVVNSLTMKNQQRSVLISEREAPGICPVCPMVNPALRRSYSICTSRSGNARHRCGGVLVEPRLFLGGSFRVGECWCREWKFGVLWGYPHGWRNLFQSRGAQVHGKQTTENVCGLNWQLWRHKHWNMTLLPIHHMRV